MSLKVAEIISEMERIADPGLALEWDNIGLQVGRKDQEVERILLALDVTGPILRRAIEIKADMIITHHPLIFKSIRSITDEIYLDLIRNDIAVYSAHTNLDISCRGVNSTLAELLELKETDLLSNQSGNTLFQIAVYTTRESIDRVTAEVFKAGAGVIGNYRECLNSYPVRGQFKPGPGSQPFLGEPDRLKTVEEIKLEFFCDSIRLENVISAMIRAHPYEEPAYAVYPQNKTDRRYGLGLTGKLPVAMKLIELAAMVKEKLGAPAVRLWKAEQTEQEKVFKVAVCGGSGSSLIKDAAAKADVFVSGDIGYHAMIESNIPIIDAGHFYTEYPVLTRLKKELNLPGIEITVAGRDDHSISSEVLISG